VCRAHFRCRKGAGNELKKLSSSEPHDKLLCFPIGTSR
jgi:hypothetical protein